MKNKIVVAEATSTAFNYLDDIRALGYEPVILEAYLPDGYARRMLDEERRVKYSRIKYPITILKEDPDYEVTLRMVKDLDRTSTRCWSCRAARRASSSARAWRTISACRGPRIPTSPT